MPLSKRTFWWCFLAAIFLNLFPCLAQRQRIFFDDLKKIRRSQGIRASEAPIYIGVYTDPEGNDQRCNFHPKERDVHFCPTRGL